MDLTSFIKLESILPSLQTTAADVNPRDPAAVGIVKERVIREMIGSIAAAGGFPHADLEDIAKAVLRREQLGTTGIGKNIAIPHSRHPSVEELVGTIALAPQGLPFESLDGEMVYVFVLLVSPQDRPGDHLRALEAVVRTMRNDEYVRQLRACTTRDEIWSLLERAPGLGARIAQSGSS